MLIFLVWGINALIFITLDFLPEDEFLSHNIEHSISKYTLELSSADVCIDEEIIFFSTHLGLLSSYDVNPHEFEIILIQRDRSPPL